jgi:hypothetical protein
MEGVKRLWLGMMLAGALFCSYYYLGGGRVAAAVWDLTVVNETGDPVAAAQVNAWGYIPGRKRGPSFHSVTDAKGRCTVKLRTRYDVGVTIKKAGSYDTEIHRRFSSANTD